MANGRVVRRCGCKGEDGKQLGRQCPKLRRADGGINTRHGSYYAQLPIQIKGRRKVLTKGGFETKTEAQAWIDEQRDKVKRMGPEIITRERVTVEAYFRTWLQDKPNLRATTRRSYEGHIRNYVIPNFGWIKMHELRAEHIAHAIRQCPAGPTTKQRIRATIKSCLSSAVKQGVIADNPAKHVELAPPTRERVEPWTDAEVAHWRKTSSLPDGPRFWPPALTGQFLDAIADHEQYAVFHVLAYRGLRRGEVCGLRAIDVELDGPHPALHIRKTLARVKGELIEGPPKSRAGRRTVPLDPGTVSVMRRYAAQKARWRLQSGAAWDDSGRAFTEANGAPLDPNRVSKLFRRMIAEHQLPPCRMHALRHGAASIVGAAGGSLMDAQALMGHESYVMTAAVYAHLFPEARRNTANATAALIPRAPGRTVDG